MRRTVVLAVLSLVAAAVCAATASAGGPVDFEQRVLPLAAGAGAGGDAATAAGESHVTPVLRAPRPFDLLGLRWRGDANAAAHVAVRVQRLNGRWSRWGEVPAAEDATADRSGGGADARRSGTGARVSEAGARGGGAGARRSRAERVRTHASGPLWTGRAVRYQLRGRVLPRGLRVHFVAVPRPRAAARSAQAESGGRPAIVPRSQWDPTNACPPRAAPRYGRVDFSIVHHTESLSGYSRAGAAAMVLAICRFHRNGNGWLDIGYNLLVDRYGTIYEGRAGGVEQPVIGAQAGGWNSVSTGVAIIGSFSSSAPPAAAQAALTRVLAWKLSLAGVPATGTIAKVSSGGDENRWPSGANVRFARVSGHRDADSTDCPGGALYALLPRLRAQIAAQLPAPVDLLTNSPFGGALAAGGPAYLTGRLALADGRRPSGVRLSLQRREAGSGSGGQDGAGDGGGSGPDAGGPGADADVPSGDTGGWVELGTVTTGTDGIWSTPVPVTVNGSFRVVAERLGIVSPAVTVRVAAGVSARVSPQLLRPGRSVTLSGATSPAKPRVTVVVERQSASGGRWTRVRRVTLDTVDGRYSTQLALPRAGLHRFVVTTAADDLNAAGAAPMRTAQVRAPARRRRR